MGHRRTEKTFGVDANGCLTEHTEINGQPVIIRYDDIPESDITTVRGLRVTTPVRTVIDLAAELSPTELERIVTDFLERGLFTLDEVAARLAQPDMADRRGAQVMRDFV